MVLIGFDIVEGTAMDALPFMESLVNNRPKKFKTVEKGIEYMYILLHKSAFDLSIFELFFISGAT